MKGILLAAVLLLPASALAGDMPVARFEELVRQLSDEDARTRDAAQSELAALEESWRPRLEDALKAASDPEATARLREILEGLGRPKWLFATDLAVREAVRLKRPILVVCAAGTPDAPRLAATTRLVKETLADPRIVKLLRERCVLLWLDLAAAAGPGAESRLRDFSQDTDEGRAQVGEGSEEMAVETMVCTPEGKVRHAIGGWWSADLWRAEVEKGLEWAMADAEKAAKGRADSQAAIDAEAVRLEREAQESGDPATSARASDLRTLIRRYAGYSHSKIGQELEQATDDAVEDFVGREFECG